MALPPSYGGRDPVRSMPTPYREGAGAAARYIADGLDAVAQAGQRTQALVDERHRVEQASSFALEFARERHDLAVAAAKARAEAAAGGAGHSDTMRKLWDDAADRLMTPLTQRAARADAVQQLANFGGQFMAGEEQWQIGAGIAHVTDRAKETFDTQALIGRNLSSLKDLYAELDRADAAAGALELPEASRHKIGAYGKAGIAKAYVQGLTERGDVTGASAALKDPRIVLALGDADTVEVLSNAVGVEQRRVEAQAAAAAAIGKAQVREGLATVSARLDAGEDVPDAELAAAAKAAASIGDESGAYKLQATRLKAGVSRETESWTPGQYRGEIDRLTALGEKRSADQDVRLRQLEAIAPGRIAEYNSNPAGYAARNGHPAPALNLADPASIRQRMQWVRTVGAATGRPVNPLTNDELTDYRARLSGGGAKAKLEVANELAALRIGDPGAAAAAARAIAPDDAMLARVVNLRAGDRAAVLNGADARKANPALIDGKSGNDARAAFLRRVGPATALLGQGDTAAAFDVARNLYADWAVKNGVQDFQSDRWNAFIHRALGGTKDAQGQYHGGIGTWNNVNVLLPEKLSQGQFEQVLTRTTWDAKNPNAPVWRDGGAMTPADVRKSYWPVRRPDGRYEFHGAGGAVATVKSGAIWLLDIARLGARLPQ